MDDTNNVKQKNSFVAIMIIQAIFALIMLFSVIFCKYFFETEFSVIKDFYIEKICADTDVNEVLKGVNNDEI